MSAVESPVKARKTRPVTEIVQPLVLQKAFTEMANATPKDIVIPSLKLPLDSQRARSKSAVASDLNTGNSDDANEQEASPYKKFEAKTLVRHPSLTKQQSKQLSPIKDTFPSEHLQHAASSPALQKILNENNEFGEDLRRRSELKDDRNKRKRHLRKLQPSLELRKSIEKDLSSKEIIVPGLPSNSPKTHRRLGLTKGLDIPRGLSASKGLVPVAIEINIEDQSHDHHDESEAKLEPRDANIEVKPKKKKYVLKKKKAKKVAEPVIHEDEKEPDLPQDSKEEKVDVDKESISVKEIRTEYDSNKTVLDKMQEAPQVNHGKEAEERKTTVHVSMEGEIKPIASDAKQEIIVVERISAKETDDRVSLSTEKEEIKKEKGGKKSRFTKKTKEKKEKKSEKKSEKKKGKTKKQEEDSDWVLIDVKGDFKKSAFMLN